MIPAIAAMGRTTDCPNCAAGGCCPVCGGAPDATSGDAWECDCGAYFTTLANCPHLDSAAVEDRVDAAVHCSMCDLGCDHSRPPSGGLVEFIAAEGCDAGAVLLAAAQRGDHL